MTISERQEQLLEELAIFQDWTERYEYVISLGKALSEMPEEDKTAENLIQGCQSQVWLQAHQKEGLIFYRADSDSLITKGMISLFIRVLDGQKAEDILTAELDFIEKMGLAEHLAPTRANALTLMAADMKKHALRLSHGL